MADRPEREYKMIDAHEKAMARATEMGERAWYDSFKIVKKDWVKYGKNRTYYEVRFYNADSFRKAFKVGYVDNDTNEWVCEC